MSILHLHALRCLDDADERVRMAACSACCRLLARATLDARPSSLGISSGNGAAAVTGEPEPALPRRWNENCVFFYNGGGLRCWVKLESHNHCR